MTKTLSRPHDLLKDFSSYLAYLSLLSRVTSNLKLIAGLSAQLPDCLLPVSNLLTTLCVMACISSTFDLKQN